MDHTAISLGAHPPKPNACLRVGVTGHRELGDSENQVRIRRDIDAILSALQSEADKARARWRKCFASELTEMRLISPLATGADSIAAQAAVDLGYTLNAALPFPVSRYRDDFDSQDLQQFDQLLGEAQRVFELHGEDATPKEAASSYLACGRLILRQSDILIAVWDGAAARGIGGTAMIIESALRDNIPVIWVHAHENAPPAFVTDDFGRGGDLSYLPELVTRLMAPPFAETADDEFGFASWRFAQGFWDEKERRCNYGLVFGAFETLLTGRSPRTPQLRLARYGKKTQAEWADYSASVQLLSEQSLPPLRQILAPRFSWADNLALYYAKLYRSSYAANYLLSALAVALALAEIIVGFGKEAFIASEVVVILTILAITVAGRRGYWHEKWIDYRQLAEQLRHIRFLYLTGGVSSESGERHDYSHGGSHGSWVQWYYQATIREIGMAPVSGSAAYLHRVRSLFVDAELTDQRAYHASNAIRMERIEHALHRAGDYFFLLTLAACLIYLGIYALIKVESFYWAADLKYSIKGWVTVLTALLPAIGAAMLGIRVQGEFSSSAERSEAMAERLNELAAELEKLDEQTLSLALLQTYVESAAETMLIEVVDWRFVFRGKPISLPA